MPKKTDNKLDYNKMVNFYDIKDVKKLKAKTINQEYKNHNIDLFFNSLMIGATGSGKINCLLTHCGLLAICGQISVFFRIYCFLETNISTHKCNYR